MATALTDPDDGYLQLVPQKFDHVQKYLLARQIAGEDVMDLVDHQHAQTNGAHQFDCLELFAISPITGLVGRKEEFKDGVVEAPLVRDGRRLHEQHRHRRVVAIQVVIRGMLGAKAFHQHGFAVVGIPDNKQIRHAVRFGMCQ